jgi:hypothetical protein
MRHTQKCPVKKDTEIYSEKMAMKEQDAMLNVTG